MSNRWCPFSWFFSNIRVRIVSGFNVVRRTEMVSLPPENTCSTGTAEPGKIHKPQFAHAEMKKLPGISMNRYRRNVLWDCHAINERQILILDVYLVDLCCVAHFRENGYAQHPRERGKFNHRVDKLIGIWRSSNPLNSEDFPDSRVERTDSSERGKSKFIHHSESASKIFLSMAQPCSQLVT